MKIVDAKIWPNLLGLFTLGFLLLSCDTIVGNPEEEGDENGPVLQLAELPLLPTLGIPAVTIAGDQVTGGDLLTRLADCEKFTKIGRVLGPVLVDVCTTVVRMNSPISGVNFDRNEDGRSTCDDYEPGATEQGILLPIFCDPTVVKTKNFVSGSRYNSEGLEHLISFTKYPESSGIGYWNAYGPATGRYPADLRIWEGRANPQGLVSLSLPSRNQGKLSIDLDDTNIPVAVAGEVNFFSPLAPACPAVPNKNDCYWQEFLAVRDAKQEDGIAAGYLTIYSDATDNASQIVMEGRLKYSELQASTYPESFADIREVYFRVVAIPQESEIWASLVLFDDTNVIDSIVDGTGKNIAEFIRDGADGTDYGGNCYSTKTGDLQNCAAYQPGALKAFWQGQEEIIVSALNDVPGVDYETNFPPHGTCRLADPADVSSLVCE